jgi:hypothetical protein
VVRNSCFDFDQVVLPTMVNSDLMTLSRQEDGPFGSPVLSRAHNLLIIDNEVAVILYKVNE